MQNIAFLVIAGLMIFFGLVFIVSMVAGVGWRWGRRQIVVAHYDINPDFDLAKVRWDSKKERIIIKKLPECALCAENRRIQETVDEINDPEVQL